MAAWTPERAWKSALDHLEHVRADLAQRPGCKPGPGIFVLHSVDDEPEKVGLRQHAWPRHVRRDELLAKAADLRAEVPVQYVLAMAPSVDVHGKPLLYATFDGPGVGKRILLHADHEWASVADALQIEELNTEDAVLPNLSGRRWED